jgi:hypothetical protein
MHVMLEAMTDADGKKESMQTAMTIDISAKNHLQYPAVGI